MNMDFSKDDMRTVPGMAILFRTILWRASTLSFLVSTILLSASLSEAQNFETGVDDKAYLNVIEKNLVEQVNASRVVFYKQVQLLDNLARQFVAAQIKENLFIALRVLAERELEEERERRADVATTDISVTEFVVSTTSTPSSQNRTKRQDDGDEDGDDGDAGAAGAGAGAIPNRPTIPPQIGLLPQVANLVRVLFGGNGNVNLTSYVQSASKLLPRPVGNQVLGLVKILTNANNANRNSFTTPNPLLQGVVPGQNIHLKSPGLTQEQLLQLGIPPPPPLDGLAGLNGLSPELIAALNINGVQGLPGAGSLAGLGGVPGLPGIPGLGGGAGGGAAAAGGASQSFPGIPPGLTPSDIAALAALGVTGLPTFEFTPPPPPAPPRSTRKPRPQRVRPSRSTTQPTLEQPEIIPTQPPQPPPAQPAYSHFPVDTPQSFHQNPQFVAAEKDILPQNLNPSKQSLSEIKQHLNSQQGPKYQETPLSPDWQEATDYYPATNNGDNFHGSINPNSGSYGQQIPASQSHQKPQQQQYPSGVHYNAQEEPVSQSQSSNVGSAQNRPNRNQRPGSPSYQQQLQAEQLHLLHLQQQHKQNNRVSDNPQQPLNSNPGPGVEQQAALPQSQQVGQQQQQQLQLQAQLQHAQQTFQQPEFQQQFQQLFQQQQQQQLQQQQKLQQSRRTPAPTIDEEESEEAEEETDPGDDRARQLNILQTIFQSLNNRNNNNNNGQQQQQQQQQPQQQGNGNYPILTPTNGNNQGNGTMPANNGQQQNTNMGFDLNMFATNLSRGIGDVVRVMPDLFRGAREGLQLIQALSTILRGFPGIADALPI